MLASIRACEVQIQEVLSIGGLGQWIASKSDGYEDQLSAMSKTVSPELERAIKENGYRPNVSAYNRTLLESIRIDASGFLDEIRKQGPITPVPRSKSGADYDVKARKDISFGLTKRFVVRIQLQKPSPADELKRISEKIVENYKGKEPINAVSILFYLPGSDINGHFTAGKVDWAPSGKWESASDVRAGDYSKHQYNIHVGNALEEVAPPANIGLSVEKQKRIFVEIVQEQDKGGDPVDAQNRVAVKHGITETEINKIKIQGVYNGWPMH